MEGRDDSRRNVESVRREVVSGAGGRFMTLRSAVVHEAEANLTTATEMAARVLVNAIDWLDEDLLGHQREWVAQVPNGRLTWKRIKQLAREAGIQVRGHFEDEPGLPDARAARRAILFLLVTIP